MRRLNRLLLLLLLLGSMLACRDTEERPQLSFSPTQLPQARVGELYSATIIVSDNVTPVGQFWVLDGALPQGLEIDHERGADTAEISGTPTQSGSFEFTLGASCLGTSVSGQRGEQLYEIVVLDSE